VFGNGSGPRPATPAGLSAQRDRDERNAMITWQEVPGATGYNVRWGVAPNKLYQTYQRFVDSGSTLELRALSLGVTYWVAIESFNEHGVSTLSAPVQIR
jgi:xylan 1,4-beta-xylosidase